MKFASKLIYGGQVHLCHTQVSTMFHVHVSYCVIAKDHHDHVCDFNVLRNV